MRGSAQIDDVFQHYMLKPYFLGGCCCCRMKSPFSFTIFLFNFVNEPHTLIFMHTLFSLAVTRGLECMSGGVYVYFVIKTVKTHKYLTLIDQTGTVYDENIFICSCLHFWLSIRRSCAECVHMCCATYTSLWQCTFRSLIGHFFSVPLQQTNYW